MPVHEKQDRRPPDPELSGAWWFAGFLATTVVFAPILSFTGRFPDSILAVDALIAIFFVWIATGSVVSLLVLGAIIRWIRRRITR
jgi:hypothetical protein